ncbi:dihydroxyacetone kinase phosphoryl donor subunit DhaM [Pyrobaculum sp.]|uniref:dihydroxyacetone kinase phosphoryl donor subunit DhaM n=1 Tax=Pyrobaculum sp. TaxID=2004705 RepID=UPI00316E6B1C
MVSIVIVSHSAKLAEGLKELLTQVAKNITIFAVGGLGEGNILGSDVNKVKDVLMSLRGEDAIIVLCDFGSTVLAVKASLKMIPEDLAKRIYLVDAPLVEGAYAAAVEASAGSPIDDVIKAAKDACNLRKFS